MSSKSAAVAATGTSTNSKRKADEIAATDSTSVNNNADKTPHQLYFDQQHKFMKEDKQILGCLMVQGIEADPDDEDYESDEENEDTSKYTTEQMESLRFIMITKNRDQQLDKMRELVLADQADSQFLSFSTSFSYHVLGTWSQIMKKRLTKMKTPSQRLDALIAYTNTIKDFDVWMHDNEGGMDELVKGLASAWKRLLKKYSDEELGWDVEYTKPGVLELLKQFKKQVEDMDECYGVGDFNYE